LRSWYPSLTSASTLHCQVLRTTSLHSGTYKDLGSWIASPCLEAIGTSFMSRRTCSRAKALILIRCFYSRYQKRGQVAAWTLSSRCSQVVIFRTRGLCLIKSKVSRNRQQWLATSMTPLTVVLLPSPFVKCTQRMQLLKVFVLKLTRMQFG
jgi:hypothetical protein